MTLRYSSYKIIKMDFEERYEYSTYVGSCVKCICMCVYVIGGLRVWMISWLNLEIMVIFNLFLIV